MAQARGAPRLSRVSRLGLALAIPVVGLAALAVSVALTHRPEAGPAPVAIGTPTPLPTPAHYPQLFVLPDDFGVTQMPRAYGALTPPQVALPESTRVELSVPEAPSGLPAALPVWRLSTGPLDPRAVADRFGIPATTTSLTENGMTSWRAGLGVDPGHGVIVWIPIGVAAPRLGGVPRDNGSALTLATSWLLSAGLAPYSGAPAAVEQTSAGDSASLPEWTVTWQRRAPGWPQYPLDEMVARVAGDGTLKQLDVSHPRVIGGSVYALRPWQDALRDALANHWYQPCCEPLPETGGAPLNVAVNVGIRYALVDTASGEFAIPMYAFDEGHGYQPGLVPAIAP